MANKSSAAQTTVTDLRRPRPAESIAVSRLDIERVFDTAEARETYLIHREISWLGARLRESRLLQGLTQKELADRARVSRATVASIELGLLTDGPKVATLSKLFRVCGKRVTPLLVDIVRDEKTGNSDEWEGALKQYWHGPTEGGGDVDGDNVVQYGDRKRVLK
jgi:transcriptional regulator with XRE-family HTH domain